MLITESETREILSPMFDDLCGIPRDAFAGYSVDYKDTAAEHSFVSKASLIHDRMIKLAHERLLIRKDVEPISIQRRICFKVSDRVILQFKKLNDKVLPQNYETAYSVSFNGNYSPTAFKTIPVSLPRLTVGYVTDQNNLLLTGIYISCQRGLHLNWHIDLVKECTSVGPNVTEIPFAQEQQPQRARVKGVKSNEQIATKSA